MGANITAFTTGVHDFIREDTMNRLREGSQASARDIGDHRYSSQVGALRRDNAVL